MDKLYLYDRIINLTLIHGKDESKNFTISCSPSGMKPDITLSVTEIPGNSCCKAEVQVRNLIIDDVREYKSMSIEAGYYGLYGLKMLNKPDKDSTLGQKPKGNGNSIVFNIDIFSSYNETPNPDGVTVFNGLVVGSITGFLSNKPVHLEIRENVTYKKLIEEVVVKASQGIMEPVIYISDDKLDVEFEASPSAPFIKDFDSGYAAIMWLQSILFTLGKKMLGYPIFLIIWDKNAYIVPLDADSGLLEDGYSKFPIVNLDAVSKASFSGPALSVVAPWVPQVLPGSLIRMLPAYYSGRTLPNIMGEDMYSNEKNLYYVITNEIKFSTVGNTNQMQLLAIPVQYVVEGQDLLTYKAPRIDLEQMSSLKDAYLTKHREDPDGVIPIIIGQQGKNGKQPSNNVLTFWNYANDNIQNLEGNTYYIGSYTTCISNSWIGTAESVYGYTPWKLTRDDLIATYGKEKYKKICKDPKTGISANQEVISIPLYHFWVMGILGTYWRYKSDNNKGPYGTWLRESSEITVTEEGGKKRKVEKSDYTEELVLDMVNPDVIRKPTTAWLPSITIGDIEGGKLDAFASAFIAFGKYYIDTYKNDKKNQNKYQFGINTYRVGVCLGGYDE